MYKNLERSGVTCLYVPILKTQGQMSKPCKQLFIFLVAYFQSYLYICQHKIFSMNK